LFAPDKRLGHIWGVDRFYGALQSLELMKSKGSKGLRKPAAKSVKPKTTTVAARRTKAETSPVTTSAASRVTPVSKPQKAASATKLKIPPILLEGDAPPAPTVSGPGQRYALGPTPTAAPAAAPGISADGHLVLRVYRGAAEGEPLSQIHLHPESRTWFVPVPAAGAKYLAELGYLDASHKWVSLTRSGATFTPPDTLSEDTSVRFATIPPEVPFEELLAMVKGAVREHVPLVEAMQQMRAQGFRNLPAPEQVKSEWTPAQEKALAEVISIDSVRRIWIGSLEITELIRRQLQQHVSSIGAAQFGLPSSFLGAPSSVTSVSSPFGGSERGRGFWFNVNAELIIYGATEPDAKVTIGDRTIKLRPDGSFSFRFALPDGQYALPAAAHSSDGVETRHASLKFGRQTDYIGEVGAHPQDKNLKPPLVSAVA
jgi:hypothetical protein